VACVPQFTSASRHLHAAGLLDSSSATARRADGATLTGEPLPYRMRPPHAYLAARSLARPRRKLIGPCKNQISTN